MAFVGIFYLRGALQQNHWSYKNIFKDMVGNPIFQCTMSKTDSPSSIQSSAWMTLKQEPPGESKTDLLLLERYLRNSMIIAAELSRLAPTWQWMKIYMS